MSSISLPSPSNPFSWNAWGGRRSNLSSARNCCCETHRRIMGNRRSAGSAERRGEWSVERQTLHDLWTEHRSNFRMLPTLHAPLLLKLMHESFPEVHPPGQFTGNWRRAETEFCTSPPPIGAEHTGFVNAVRAIDSKRRCAKEQRLITFTKFRSDRVTPHFCRLDDFTR